MSAAPAGAMPGAPETSPLVHGLRVLRERWLAVVAAVVVCTGAAVGLSVTGTKEYEASSSLLIQPSNLAGLIDVSAVQPSDDPARTAATNLLLVTSSAVAERVRSALNEPASADDLRAEVDASAEPDANLIHIKVRDPDPGRAARLADAFADQFVAFRTEANRQRVQEAEKLLQRQIDSLPPGASAQRTAFEQALQKVIALRAVTTGDAEVIDRAKAPTTPVSPTPKRAAALGIALGLVAGLALAFLVDLFDQRVKTVEEAEALYGIRALSAVPQRPRLAAAGQRDRQVALEPFRVLRNGLGFLSLTGEVRVVLVTSAVPAEGKSTVAAGLARATALAGHRVVLVEADLRRPTFHHQFDLAGDRRGLTTALIGGASVRGLVHQVMPGSRTLGVLPSGPIPPNSAELLRSAAMGEVLAELTADAELVILDAPPLLAVADAQVLLDLPQVDAALIVARAFHTTREEIRRARAVLDRHRLDRFGLVVNGVRDPESSYEYYGASEPGAGRLGSSV